MPTPFQNKVYSIVKKIPKGKTKTYGEIAKALKTSPRAVGQALKANKNHKEISCHRVIGSDGNLGGYNLGVKKKIELLKKEGVNIKENRVK